MKAVMIAVLLLLAGCEVRTEKTTEEAIIALVHEHARAWETGDVELLDKVLHDEVVFAYPGRRLNKEETLEDLRVYKQLFTDTKIYIHTIIVQGEDVAVEWQFASTNTETGNRTAVSDAIIGRVEDGKIIMWKEYLDGRVSRMQANGELPLEEGEEPFPWPRKLKDHGT